MRVDKGRAIDRVCERFGLTPLFGYLLAGTLLGPNALDLLPSHEAVGSIAELGIALLLFTIGIDFSWRRLREVGRVAQPILATEAVIERRPAWSADGRSLVYDDDRGQAHVMAHQMLDLDRLERGHTLLGAWLDGRRGEGGEQQAGAGDSGRAFELAQVGLMARDRVGHDLDALAVAPRDRKEAVEVGRQQPTHEIVAGLLPQTGDVLTEVGEDLPRRHLLVEALAGDLSDSCGMCGYGFTLLDFDRRSARVRIFGCPQGYVAPASLDVAPAFELELV